MRAKHTPGPWILYKYTPGDKDLVISTAGCFVTIDDCTTAERKRQFANARLMAAAPDLLEALETYSLGYTDEQLDQFATTDSGSGEISPQSAAREIKRRAAITKATGKESA